MDTYDIQVHPLVYSVDILELPEELRNKFKNQFYQNQLNINPTNPRVTPSFQKRGKLKDCRALHISWDGDPNAYRLVYQILNKPAPRRVLILSFAEHEKTLEGKDPPYFKALERLGRLRKKKS